MSTQDSNSQQCFPTLCKNGCGFFRSIDAKGFCSVCYKDYLKKEAVSATATDDSNNEDEVPTTVAMSQLTLEEETVSEEPEESADIVIPDLGATAAELPALPSSSADQPDEKKEDQKDPKKKKSRCLSCKKKLGLTGFSCRCGGLYCAIHRYSDKHECGFDYKAMGEKEISENNPLIVAQKVAKI